MIQRPPRSTRTDTLFPYTPLFRSVYLSVTGFGQSGPNSKLPTTDSLIQAYSGWMTLHRDSEGVPMRSGLIAVDVMTGLYARSEERRVGTACVRKLRITGEPFHEKKNVYFEFYL